MIKKAYSDKRVASFFPLNKRTVLLFLLLPLIGCTTPSQWKADALVDELCAEDGGIKVYETVTLPRNRFNEWGQFHVPDKNYAKPTDEYYSDSETKKIPSSSSLSVYQSHYWVYRRSDQKVLGENITYWRRGGDPPLPVHPSSYGCPRNKIGITEQIFLKSNN